MIVIHRNIGLQENLIDHIAGGTKYQGKVHHTGRTIEPGITAGRFTTDDVLILLDRVGKCFNTFCKFPILGTENLKNCRSLIILHERRIIV